MRNVARVMTAYRDGVGTEVTVAAVKPAKAAKSAPVSTLRRYGETNATIPRGETVEAVDFARAVQLLADKRAKGPAPKRATRTTTRKAPAKK